MGYTHGTKWTEKKIVEGILGVKNALDINYMPSKTEIISVTGNKGLTCAIARHGGYIFFRDLLGLEDKDSCTKIGDENYTIV